MTPYEYSESLRVCLPASAGVSSAHRPLDQSLPGHLPQVSTLRVLFSRYLDINAIPKRSFFQLLKHFATDEREREKLEEFSSPEGAVNYLPSF